MSLKIEDINNDVAAMEVHRKLGHSFNKEGICEQCHFIENYKSEYKKEVYIGRLFVPKNKYILLINYIYRIRNNFKMFSPFGNLLLLTNTEEELKEYYNILINEKRINKYLDKLTLENVILGASFLNMSNLKVHEIVKKIYIKNNSYLDFIQYKLQGDEPLFDKEIEAINKRPYVSRDYKKYNINAYNIMMVFDDNIIKKDFVTREQIEAINNVIFLYVLREMMYQLYNIFDRKSGYAATADRHNNYKKTMEYIDQRLYKLDKSVFKYDNIDEYAFYPSHFTTEQLNEILNPFTKQKMEYLERIANDENIKIEVKLSKEEGK